MRDEFENSAASPTPLTWTWQAIVASILLPALAVFAASDAWSDIVSIACKDEEASHILLVPFVVGWLVWVRRDRLRFLRARGNMVGCGIVAAGWLMYVLGYDLWIQALWHGGAVIMAIGAIITVIGTDVLKELLPAFFALLFVIPVPGTTRQFIALPLEGVTANVTQYLLELLGSTVDRSGNLLSVHHISVTIAEACNGMRMMSALGVVLYAFAFGTPLSFFARLFVLAATPIVAVVFNVIRLVPTVWVYGNFSPTVADRFHAISGWIMLILAFMSLRGALHLFKWAMEPIAPFRLAND